MVWDEFKVGGRVRVGDVLPSGDKVADALEDLGQEERVDG